jgi:S1-C subfamily serine protease
MKLEPSADGNGLEVKDLKPNSATAKADVKVGDVIIQVNRKPVKTVEEFKEALKHSNTGSHMLYIERGGTAMLQMVPGD